MNFSSTAVSPVSVDPAQLQESDALHEIWLLAVQWARQPEREGFFHFLGGLWNRTPRSKPIKQLGLFPPNDCQVLAAYLAHCRAFTRQASLLAELGTPARSLSQQLKRLEQASNKPAFGTTALSEGTEPVEIDLNASPLPLLQLSRELALEYPTHGEMQQDKKQFQVDVEHLLLALCRSRDPVVAQLVKTNGWTEAKILQAARVVQKKATWLLCCYVVRELVEILVVVLTFLIIIKEGFGELRLIPSESMVPLLQIEDRIVIEKLARWWRPYQRGDVLVFYPPMTELKNDPISLFLRSTGFSNAFHKKEDNIDVAYIKRLIGLPGDTVDVRPGDGVYVNGVRLNEPYTNEIALSCTRVDPVEICGPVTVPPKHFFMMGDNRNQSADSRYWGFEPLERVVGRAVFRVWPVNRFGVLPDVHPAGVRPTQQRTSQ